MSPQSQCEEEETRGGTQFKVEGDLSSFCGLTESKVIKYERQKQWLLSSLSQLVATIGPRRWKTADFSQGSPCDSCLSNTERTSPDMLEGDGREVGGGSSVDRKDEVAWLKA